MTPRSVRNNNPGNLTIGAHWQGLMPPDAMTPDQVAERVFAVFVNPTMGFRALAKDLLNQRVLHGYQTVKEIMYHYAPPSENDTEAYITAICAALSCKRDDIVPLSQTPILTGWVRAIAMHEGDGRWDWTDDELKAGVAAALGV